MSIEELRALLGWCALLNMLLMLIWLLALQLAKPWVFQLHRRWFALSDEDFERIHYAAMAAFKLLTLMFTLIPYLVLRLLL